MVGVVAYPGCHFFAAFKYGALYQQRLEFDCVELAIPCFYFLFAKVTQVQVVNLVIQKHVKRDFVVHFVFIEINIPGVIHSAYHILDTRRGFKNAVGSYGSIGIVVKSYIIINFVAAFVYIAYKFHGQQSSSVYISFVPVTHFKKVVEKRESFAIAHAVVNCFAIKLILATFAVR